jgi:acetoin utilization protein AcuB
MIRALEVPVVRDLMTATPAVIDGNEDTLAARSLMDEHGVRHLPVLVDGELFGVVSERDLRAARAFLDAAPGEIGPPVSAVCSRGPYVVGPDAAIDDVAIEVANRRLGAAIVVEDGAVVGIVTTVDLCRELARLVGRLRTASA